MSLAALVSALGSPLPSSLLGGEQSSCGPGATRITTGHHQETRAQQSGPRDPDYPQPFLTDPVYIQCPQHSPTVSPSVRKACFEGRTKNHSTLGDVWRDHRASALVGGWGQPQPFPKQQVGPAARLPPSRGPCSAPFLASGLFCGFGEGECPFLEAGLS